MNISADYLTGPTTELVALLWQVIAANLPRDLTWPVLLITALLATGIWLARNGHGAKNAKGCEQKTTLFQFLLPKDIYTHVSARVDIALYVFERILRPLWVAPVLILLAPAIEQSVIATMNTLLGTSPRLAPTPSWMLLYSLITLLLYDAIFYLIHYSEHKIPALWAIHKIHHSAEVLTPLTRYREHFIEGPIYAVGAALAYGLAGGLFGWIFVDGITQATLFNIGFFSLLFGFNGSFRHYHVAFHYPPWLSKWLHSPVMHHVHHSYLPQHWDKNFAAVTSIWDRLFATLHIPKKDETTPWGLGPETQDHYRTFLQNTLGPFRDWHAMAFGTGQTKKSTED